MFNAKLIVLFKFTEIYSRQQDNMLLHILISPITSSLSIIQRHILFTMLYFLSFSMFDWPEGHA